MNTMDRIAGARLPAVVITGATEGIGRALADEFARDGHTLLLVARHEAGLARAAAELSKTYGVTVRTTAQDLGTEEGCTGLEEALDRFGLYADILVNNAAIMLAGFFQDQQTARTGRVIDLNVRGIADLMLRLLPGMMARNRGAILNVASVEGFMPVPYQAVYAASKAFVLSLSRAVSYEASGTNVRVQVLAPGAVATEIHAKGGAEYARYVQLFPVMTAEEVARYGYRQFKRGKKVIVPGWLNRLYVTAVRFVPSFLLIPTIGWFFRVRDAEGNLQWPRSLRPVEPKPQRVGQADLDGERSRVLR
jgi:short-subunit dehydrogenase